MTKRSILKIATVFLVISAILALALISVNAASEDAGGWAKTLFGTRYYYTEDQYYIEGWYEIDGEDYYFEDGVVLDDGLQLVEGKWYVFGEDGRSTAHTESGFYTDRNGYAYSKDGSAVFGLQEIEGKLYYFDEDGYAQKNGRYEGYFFTEGYEAYTGLYEEGRSKYYYVNGKASYTIKNENGTLKLYKDGSLAGKGMYKLDGDYYYSDWGGVLIVGQSYYVSATYAIDGFTPGNYTFGEDGRMLEGVVQKNGVSYLYVKGNTVNKGLYEIDGDYYYADWGGVVILDQRYYVSSLYATEDIPAGSYAFGKDGKMLDGIVDAEGTLKLYIKGNTVTKGLYEIDGDYYYADWGGIVILDRRYYVSNLFETEEIPAGEYSFGADGKMIDGVVDANGTLKLYRKGNTVTKGLYELDGDYYYSDWGGVLILGKSYYVSNLYATEDIPAGNYAFGADGRMLDGVVETDGTYKLYIKGNTVSKGIYNVDGDVYYSDWGGVLNVNGRHFLSTTFATDEVPSGNYDFGADGKMLEGIVEKDGELCCYVKGNKAPEGIIKLGDDLYYVKSDGKIVVDCTYYVEVGNGYTVALEYVFDEYGKIVDYAYIESSEGLEFELNSDGKSYTLVGIGTCTDTDIVIDYYKDLPVTAIKDKAFNLNADIESVTIGNTVTSIGSSAFAYCSELTSITLPNALESIGNCAFSGCSGISNIEIPQSVTNIGMGAFWGCSGLESVIIPESIVDISPFTFAYCSSLESVEIPDSVTAIGSYAFYNCSKLDNVEMPSSVIEIGYCAFRYCNSFTSVVFENPEYWTVEETKIPKSTLENVSTSATYLSSMYANKTWICEIPAIIPSSEGLEFRLNEDGESYTVIGIGTCTDTDIVISHYNGLPVTSIDSWAFQDCIGITSVTIGDCVTSIGHGAFYNCSELTGITIPDSVTSIVHGAFYNCSELTGITIPDSVTSIGDLAFYGCSGLESITVESGNTTYHSKQNCLIETATKTLIVGCKNSVIPDDGSVTKIDGYAFYDCRGLTNITIPDSVTIIGMRAFMECSGLTSLTISDSVTIIGDKAFHECGELESITVENGNTKYHSEGNCLIEIETKTLIVGCKNSVIPNDGSVISIGSSAFSYCSGLTSITIPDSIISIGSYAFSNCSGLTSITIPNSVTSIDSGTFFCCSKLTSIDIPDSVTTIGERAFFGCSGLTSVKIPTTVTSIGADAFYGVPAVLVIPEGTTSISDSQYTRTSYSAVIIPSSVTSIGNSAFASCTKLTSVIFLGDSKLESIGDSAFLGCSALANIALPGSVENISPSAFYSCSNLSYTAYDNGLYLGNSENPYFLFVKTVNKDISSLSFADSVKVIGEKACASYYELESIEIPNSVVSIGNYAFNNCDWLTSVTYEEGSQLESIGSYAFADSARLASIEIPESVVSIGDHVFYNCAAMTGVTFAKGSKLESIGDYAFSDCSALVSIEIPKNVTSIGERITNKCSSLQAITVESGNTEYHLAGNCLIETDSKTVIWGCADSKIPSDGSVVSIGNYSFDNCADLTEITIPKTVVSIGEGAFHGCDSLEGVTFAEGTQLVSIDKHAFSGCHALKDMQIPSTVETLGDHAFHECASLTGIILPETLTSIGSYAFYGCTGLTELTIPANVTYIGSAAFCRCSNLKSVTFVDYKNWQTVGYGLYGPSYSPISPAELKDPETAAKLLVSSLWQSSWCK